MAITVTLTVYLCVCDVLQAWPVSGGEVTGHTGSVAHNILLTGRVSDFVN